MNVRVWLIGALSAVLLLGGCDRKPEDLEVWRNAEGGYAKMAEWARSDEEPDAVRVRAVQILIEEHQPNELQPLFEAVENPATRKMLVDGAVPTVAKMWNEKDWPKIDEEDAKAGGLVKVDGRSESVGAKDAAYFLQPYAEGESKKQLETILAQWMSQDQDVRNQLGVTTIAQIAPRASDEGIDMMLKWLEKTTQPAAVVEKIMTADGASENEEVTAALATAIRKRAEKEHPKLSPQTEGALLRITHENLAPYLEMAIQDPESPPRLVDASMDVYVRSMGDKATPFFVKLITEKDGLLRWVSATRLIELRGKAGVLAAAKALPLEKESYARPEEDSFKKRSEVFCNFVNTLLKEQGLENADDVVINLLQSDRWPAQVLGLRCAGVTKAEAAKPQVDALEKSKDTIPGWGEKKTIGDLAEQVSGELAGE